MKTRRIIALSGLVLVAVVLLSACGSTKKREVPANAIAVVGNQVIARSQYDGYLAQTKEQYKQSKKAFPAVGSTEYESIRDRIVAYLVQVAAVDQQAANMGINITDAEVNSSLQSVIKQRFNGNKSKFQAELSKEHLTEQQLKEGLRQNLISQRVQTAVVQGVNVSDGDVKKYYDEHKSSYQKPESRKASHILVKTKAEADSIYQQLKAGADFAKLAKKYSTDPGSKSQGGSLGVVEKGKTVPAFEKVLFALETGAFSQPVKSNYGWHIILATGPIVPKHTQTLAEASASIRQTLLSDKQNTAITNWVHEANKYAADNTVYAPGYEPPKTSSSTVATTATTTG
jgi:foldase protein PrsA